MLMLGILYRNQARMLYFNYTSFSPLLSELDAGSVGLALSYSVTLMGMFQWGVRQSAEVENMVRCLSCLCSAEYK